jgi:hypothetical protein
MPLTRPSVKPTILRRLPEGYAAPGFPRWSASPATRKGLDTHSGNEALVEQDPATPLYRRTEGGLQSRLLGTAIHALLEELSRLRRNLDPTESSQALADSLPAITAEIRSAGLPRAQAERLADEAFTVARQASIHPLGAWILTPHPEAAAESRWTALTKQGPAGSIWNLRPDRIFFAPADPSIDTETPPVWWIIDYKTSHASGADLQNPAARQSFLSTHRQQHLGQLAAYAQVLRSLRQQHSEETTRIRAGIFYPRLQILDHWDA